MNDTLNQRLEKADVAKLVPHAGKMLLLSRIARHNVEERMLVSEVDIAANDLFYDETLKGVPVWVGFEYMAQSISALSGIYNRHLDISPRVGFIVSVSAYKANAVAFAPGTTVSVKVHETMRIESDVMFTCEIKCGETVLATGMLNALEVDDPQKIKRELNHG